MILRLLSPMRGLATALFLATALTSFAAGPVAFEFSPTTPSDIKNPYARELWAEVFTPSGRVLLLPAYYAGDKTFAVHARPDEAGVYRLGKVTETSAGRPETVLPVAVLSAREVEIRNRTRLPAVGLDPQDPRGFRRSDGHAFIPLGANVAWPEGDCVPFYRDTIAEFAKANLNWMRVWMVHWGHLNLDWVPAWAGAMPKIGGIDPVTAANWDALLAAAEEKGVYLQIVFQHHGQYTTGENSNWNDNPWNAANPGGFLKTPGEFFTSPQARLLTMLKYRYIVARWGWSPAVFAWELFNEVHWVDALSKEHNEAAVAQWHSDLAAYVRSIDRYGHLVTTSTENLSSPIYENLDFYQPHLYSADLLTGARSVALPAGRPVRPVFYGEFGDDHVDLPAAVRESGVTFVPPAWAGLFGESGMPAQLWLGANLVRQGRANELGAVLRFAFGSHLAQQHGLAGFSPRLESAVQVPLVLNGVQNWQRQKPPELTLTLDGRPSPQLGEIPRIYVGYPSSVAEGFPDHATYHLTVPRDTAFRAKITGLGNGPSAFRATLDGRTVAEKSWAAGDADRPAAAHPAEIPFSVPAGEHTLVVANSGQAEWLELAGLDTGLTVSSLSAFGRRNDHFIAAWVWNRPGVFAPAPAPVSGTLILPDVPAGLWTVTWWDTLKGAPAGPSEKIPHAGGDLRLPTPAIARHAAVSLILK